jgi:predicted transcriptional regulator
MKIELFEKRWPNPSGNATRQQISMRIPPDLWEAVRVAARDHGMTRTNVAEAALRHFLEQSPQEQERILIRWLARSQ